MQEGVNNLAPSSVILDLIISVSGAYLYHSGPCATCCCVLFVLIDAECVCVCAFVHYAQYMHLRLLKACWIKAFVKMLKRVCPEVGR